MAIFSGIVTACAHWFIRKKVMFTRDNLLPETARISADDHVSCFVVALCSHGVGLGAQNTRETIAIRPDQEKFQHDGDDRHRKKTFRIHQDVKCPNVEDHRSENS